MNKHSSDPVERVFALLNAILTEVRENPAIEAWLLNPAQMRPLNLPVTLAGDILRGAEAIAIYLFGDARHRKRVYRLIAGGKLPHFRIGRAVCSRKSLLKQWVETASAS